MNTIFAKPQLLHLLNDRHIIHANKSRHVGPLYCMSQKEVVLVSECLRGTMRALMSTNVSTSASIFIVKERNI